MRNQLATAVVTVTALAAPVQLASAGTANAIVLPPSDASTQSSAQHSTAGSSSAGSRDESGLNLKHVLATLGGDLEMLANAIYFHLINRPFTPSPNL